MSEKKEIVKEWLIKNGGTLCVGVLGVLSAYYSYKVGIAYGVSWSANALDAANIGIILDDGTKLNGFDTLMNATDEAIKKLQFVKK